jgi:nucleotide sugar dehydrogenase
VKIYENSKRDNDIAFSNEFAMACDVFHIDASEVISGAKTKPFGYGVADPGCGVGGHCIAVDPYYMIDAAAALGFDHKIMKMSREINEGMPLYTVRLLEKRVGDLKGEKVGVLGVSYKPDIDDCRESPSLVIIDLLKKRGAEVYVYDPHVPKHSNVNYIGELFTICRNIILTTAHKEFKEISLEDMASAGVMNIIDGRNCLNKEKAQQLGVYYKGVGR